MHPIWVLHSICQQTWKTQQGPQDWKWSVFIPIAKKGNIKECSNYCTIVLIIGSKKQGSYRKYLLLLFWLCQSLWLCGSQQTVKILKEMGIPDHMTCLLRNLYAGQETTVRSLHGTTDWFKIGKGVRQGCILSFCLFNSHAEYILWNARLDESQPVSKLLRQISITSNMQMISL